jgi:hypothetical protein
MFEIAYGAALLGACCLTLSVGYPLCAAIAYPLYRFLGGRRSFRNFMKEL